MKILATFSSCRCRGFCCCCCWSPDTKTQWHGYFFLLLLLWILATCCCYEYEVWLPFPPAGPRIGKHHCSGKTPWQWRTEKPQNCSPKMPNVTSETYRKWWFLRLFLLAAAMNFGYLFLLLLQKEAFAAAAAGPRIGKHHGSEGRRSPKIAFRKCLT